MYRSFAASCTSSTAGWVLIYDQILQRVWGEMGNGDVRPMRTIVSKVRRKLDDDACNPTYIFTEPRDSYRIPTRETQGQKKARERVM